MSSNALRKNPRAVALDALVACDDMFYDCGDAEAQVEEAILECQKLINLLELAIQASGKDYMSEEEAGACRIVRAALYEDRVPLDAPGHDEWDAAISRDFKAFLTNQAFIELVKKARESLGKLLELLKTKSQGWITREKQTLLRRPLLELAVTLEGPR